MSSTKTKGEPVQPHHLRRIAAALTVAVLLAACGGDPAVTADEGAAFRDRVRDEVPALASIVDEDLDTLADSVCTSLDGGQSYGNVSETVAAYTGFDVAFAEVDTVIRVAVETACPELADRI